MSFLMDKEEPPATCSNEQDSGRCLKVITGGTPEHDGGGA